MENITGKEAFRFEQKQEDAINALTEALLASEKLGNNAPRVYEGLKEVLFHMLQIATCQWGCKQGNHVIENLVRRCYNSACATLRLMASGLYDEALGSVRATVEITNLLQAFEKDRAYLEQWKTSSYQERQREFCSGSEILDTEETNLRRYTVFKRRKHEHDHASQLYA